MRLTPRRPRFKLHADVLLALPDAWLSRAVMRRSERHCRTRSPTGSRRRCGRARRAYTRCRQALSDILGLPQSAVRVIYAEGAGCYGHNGADDAAADAALDVPARRATGARAVDALGRTWMGAARPRDGAHAERRPRCKRATSSRGAHGVYAAAQQSTGRWRQPAGRAGNRAMPPALPTAPVNLRDAQRAGELQLPGDQAEREPRAALPDHRHGAAATPLVNTLPRSSALRSLGGMSNCFANESFMDELALAANADPIAFRKQYVCALSGGSGSAVQRAGRGWRSASRRRARRDGATGRMGQSPSRQPSAGAVAGKGVAFARYETVETYVAAYVEVEVTTATGDVWVRRVVVAHDCGLIINPDGLRNQIEGNVIQGISRTLIEEVRIQQARASPACSGPPTRTPPPVVAFQPGAVVDRDRAPRSPRATHARRRTTACMGCRRT